MTDDIDSMDRLMGPRPEDRLNPIVKSNKHRRRGDQNPEEISEEEQRRSKRDRVVLRGNDASDDEVQDEKDEKDETNDSDQSQDEKAESDEDHSPGLDIRA